MPIGRAARLKIACGETLLEVRILSLGPFVNPHMLKTRLFLSVNLSGTAGSSQLIDLFIGQSNRFLDLTR